MLLNGRTNKGIENITRGMSANNISLRQIRRICLCNIFIKITPNNCIHISIG